MSDTTFIDGTVIEPAWLNDVNDATYTTVPANTTAIAALSSDLSNSANALKGAGQVGIDWSLLYAQNTAGWGVRTAGQSYNILRTIPVAEWAAIFAGTSTYDVTSIINTALSTYKDVFLPAGVYSVNPDTGIQVVAGCTLRGAGKNKTIIAPVSQGGTTAELASYTKGSVIRRTFNVAPGTNSYVNDVHLSDFAIVLNHPTGSVTTTEIQIGIDLRNITRCIVERVHVGNIAPVGGTLVKSDPAAGFREQGYGIVIGNVASGLSSYAGGEVNTIRDCSVWGARKGIVHDDATLSPNSAAHACIVENCDIQSCHDLLVQESQYSSGVVWSNNTLQNIGKQSGDASTAYVMRFGGYNSRLHAKYIEVGSTVAKILRLDSTANNNTAILDYYSATGASTIEDGALGGKNKIRYWKNTGSISGGVDSLGEELNLYSGALESSWVKFHWNGSAIVIDGNVGAANVSRTGTGDYTVTWDFSFPSDDYFIAVTHDSNVSGHPACIDVFSHGTTNARIFTYSQNAGTTTQIDPRFVWVLAKQL